MPKITLMPESETQPSGNTRPLMMKIEKREQLYQLYMPSLKNAGMFIPGTLFGGQAPSGAGATLPPPGSKIMMLVTLPDDPTRNAVSGKVAWITSQASPAGGMTGVGVHFDDAVANKQLRDKIEKLLAGVIGKSEVRTMTM